MSWFGETFGDSLTSLKGQITKITKEVLADDDSSIGKTEANDSSLKELTALCESKDLEISSLREEYVQLETQLKYQLELLKKENENLKRNWSGNESESDQLKELQKEITQLIAEKNHLNNCIDELQSEHETNLSEVVSIRDKYKKELEELKKEHGTVKSKLEELSNQQKVESMTSSDKNVLKEKESLIESLKGQIENLQSELNETLRKEQEYNSVLKKEKENYDIVRKELEKLKIDMETLKKEKSDVEEENRSIQKENKCVQEEVQSIKINNNDLKDQIKSLTDANEKLVKQLSESTNESAPPDESLISVADIEQNLVSLLKLLDVNDIEGKCANLNDKFQLIQSKLNLLKKTSNEKDENLRRVMESHDSEYRRLKEQNSQQQNELNQASSKWMEKEKKYQEDLRLANEKLQETTDLKLKLLEMEKQSQIHSQSQTDDVKKLEQEVSQLHYMCEMKTNEIAQLLKSKTDLEREVSDLKNLTENMRELSNNSSSEAKKLEDAIQILQNKEVQLNSEKQVVEKKCTTLMSENACLVDTNNKLKSDIEQYQQELAKLNNEKKMAEDYLQKAQVAVADQQNLCSELQKMNAALKNEFENLKAQNIVRESSITELMKSNVAFQNEMSNMQAQVNELKKKEEECEKWKNVSIDLELQIQDLNSKVETLESESLKLQGDLKLVEAKDNEILQLKQTNHSLTESCNRLHQELENKMQGEQFGVSKEADLNGQIQHLSQIITELREENGELKSRIQKFQEQMKIQVFENEELSRGAVQQHRRSKSDFDPTPGLAGQTDRSEALLGEIAILKQAVENEKRKHEELLREYQGLSDKEANARKEFERLKQHLIEVEDHYTEEAVENEKIINELKSKLMAAEEQLSKSSTLYTSAKIRDNQHVESLQNQLRLVGAQRDEFQAKLSGAEDEIQKHKAALTSLQIVLEQFQQDKQREAETLAAKYEKQLELTRGQFKSLEIEIEGLQKQLSEAKNGLQAASRLGEQLERKSQKIADLELQLGESQKKITELEDSLNASNQSVHGKVDKSLVKNLVAGYISSPNGDRKSQALRILATVLDFDQEERNKMEVDASNSGWLASILHPKGGGPPTNESLSQAFIKFLESESRPQPQLNLLPDHYKTAKPKTSTSAAKTQGVFSELVLPTFNSSQENESSVILKNVLKDS